MLSLSDIEREVLEAEHRITPYIRRTEVRKVVLLPDRPAFLKLENTQYTGSFKARGSLNKIMSLSAREREAGVITASSGNHGLGVARSLQVAGVRGSIFLPSYAERSKVEALKAFDIPLHFVDGTWDDTERHAKHEAARQRATWVSPYNDRMVIGGQGTIGHELAAQLDTIDRIFITVGGGGLMSGVGGYLKRKFPRIQIIGCQPENSPEMYLSIKAGKVIFLEEQKETLSDGSAGSLEADSITFPVCRSIIDDFCLVSETEIATAMRLVYKLTGERIEGSAGVAVAAFLKMEHSPGTDVVVICGGNISGEKFVNAIGTDSGGETHHPF